MELFFTAEHGFHTIRLPPEDILPEETTSASVQARAVYQSYGHALAARPSDEDLRPFRRKTPSCAGNVTTRLPPMRT